MPSLGWQSYRLEPTADADGWKPLDGNEIGNDHYRLRVDPERGGGVISLVEASSDRELIADGKVGNELAVYDEYPAHPAGRRGPVASAAEGAGRLLVGERGRGSGVPRPAW